MTTPAPGLDADGLPPLWDAGNTMLAIGEPVQMIIGKMPAPQGEIGIVTLRTKTTTLTVSLDKAAASDWTETLAELRDSLSGTSLIIPGKGQAAAISQAAVSAKAAPDGGRPG